MQRLRASETLQQQADQIKKKGYVVVERDDNEDSEYSGEWSDSEEDGESGTADDPDAAATPLQKKPAECPFGFKGEAEECPFFGKSVEEKEAAIVPDAHSVRRGNKASRRARQDPESTTDEKLRETVDAERPKKGVCPYHVVVNELTSTRFWVYTSLFLASLLVMQRLHRT